MEQSVSYDGYQNMVAQVNTGLTQLEELCGRLNLDKNSETLLRSRRKLASHHFSVGILGEFKRGKSTVINSLLGEEIMPADILPCSATMNRVTYDLAPHAKLLMVDGTEKEISVTELKDYVTKLTRETEAVSATVDEAVVYYPCKFCQNGVDIVDTPGLNDDDRMNRITENVIPKLDAIIMVLTYDSPFSMSEAEFVRNKLMTSDIGKLIFLVNKMDLVRRASDKQRVLDEITKKIQKAVLEKTAQLYGETSKEYETAAKKLANVKVLPFSAADALDGKLEGDAALIQSSGTVEFEQLLTRMLTQERGALELGTPINIILRTAEEVCQNVAARKLALTSDSEQFRERKEKTIAEIRAVRIKKQEETERLKISAEQSKKHLFQKISSFYDTLEDRLITIVMEQDISTEQLKTEEGRQALVEQMQEAISAEMKCAMGDITEVTEHELREIAGTEGIKIGEFIYGCSADLSSSYLPDASTEANMVKSFGAEAAVWAASGLLGGYVPGLGGVIEGYKAAGLKGAVVSGIGSAAVGTAAMAIAMSTLSVVGLPLAIIGAVAGTLSGKMITKFLFPQDSDQKVLDKTRANFVNAVQQMVTTMRTNQELEQWTGQRVETCFRELTEAMETECERLLCDTESTMESIQQEIGQNEAQRTILLQQYDEITASVNNIVTQLQPTAERVMAVLAQA